MAADYRRQLAVSWRRIAVAPLPFVSRRRFAIASISGLRISIRRLAIAPLLWLAVSIRRLAIPIWRLTISRSALATVAGKTRCD